MAASNDPFFSAVQNAAATRTYRLAVRLGLSREDREDLMQDLTEDMLALAGKFDPAKSSAATFTGVVSQHRTTELLNEWNKDRSRLEFAAQAPASNDLNDSGPMDSVLDCVLQIWSEETDLFANYDTMHDLEMAIAYMSDEQVDLIRLLAAHQDQPSAAKASGISSSNFYRRIDDLKMHLRMFGFKSSA